MISLKNQIKSLLAVLVVALAAFAGVAAILFRQNFEGFTDFIGEKSKNHLEALSALTEVETGLYLHEQALACALASGSDKCLITLRETEQVVSDQFKFLETFNKAHFPDWIASPRFDAVDPEGELRGLIASYQEAASHERSRAESWQRLYALVRANAEDYFRSSGVKLKSHLEGTFTDAQNASPGLTAERKTLDLLFLGVAELRERYNDSFWRVSQARDADFTRDTANYYRALVIGSSLLILMAGLIALLVHRHFRVQEAHEENLVRLGTRDLATGLFNRRSLEAMLAQEIERAKRRNYALSIVLLRVEPFEKLRVELGQVAADRLFFQIAEVLRASCRAYDGIFKADANSFVVVLPEAHPRIINELCGRFLARIGKKRFLVKSDQTKVAPTVLTGAAAYPLNGAKAEDLLKFAEMTLSEKFDARILEKNVGAMAGPAPAPSVPAEEPQPALDTAAPQQNSFSAASVIAKLKARAARGENPAAPEPSAPQVEPQTVAEVIPIVKTDATEEGAAPPAESATKEPAVESAFATDLPSEAEVTVEPVINNESEAAPAPRTSAMQESTNQPEPTIAETHPPVTEAAAADEIPDVINALLQNESENAEPASPAVEPLPDSVAHEGEANATGRAPAPEIQVVKQENEDVIMVDFDRERADLAERFRRKRGQKPASK